MNDPVVQLAEPLYSLVFMGTALIMAIAMLGFGWCVYKLIAHYDGYEL